MLLISGPVGSYLTFYTKAKDLKKYINTWNRRGPLVLVRLVPPNCYVQHWWNLGSSKTDTQLSFSLPHNVHKLCQTCMQEKKSLLLLQAKPGFHPFFSSKFWKFLKLKIKTHFKRRLWCFLCLKALIVKKTAHLFYN